MDQKVWRIASSRPDPFLKTTHCLPTAQITRPALFLTRMLYLLKQKVREETKKQKYIHHGNVNTRSIFPRFNRLYSIYFIL